MIGKNVWKIGVPIAISPLHKDKDRKRKWWCKETALSRYLYCEQSCDCRCSEKKIKAVLSSEDIECKAVARVQVIYESVENTYLLSYS